MLDITNTLNKKIDLRKAKPLTWASANPVHAISLDLTKRCTLRCDYCFTHLNNNGYSPNDLSEEDAYKVIEWLLREDVRGNNKKIDITFWGGEPLMQWELLKKIVLYANKRGQEEGVTFTYGMTTNVTLLTPEKFSFFKEHKIEFLLSMDGTKEHHDAHRKLANGKGSWDLCDKNATDILKEWPNAAVRISYTADKIHEFMDDINYFYNKGFKHIVYSPVLEGDWNEERKEKLREVFMQVSDFYIEKTKAGEQITIKSIDDACKGIGKTEKEDRSPCGAGRGYLCITTDLSIFPCHRFNKFNDNRPWYEKEWCLGHVEHGLLNKATKDKFDKWSIHKHMEDKCNDCENHGIFCFGGCWATNQDIMGDITKLPDLDCYLAGLHRELSVKLPVLLGKQFEEKVKRMNGIRGSNDNVIPAVQGCSCYNVQDSLYGTFVEDNTSEYKCLCNMATYGNRPSKPDKCGCYNVQDSFISRYDQSGMKCKNFEHQNNPLEETMNYLSNMNSDSLTDEDIEQLVKFQTMIVSTHK